MGTIAIQSAAPLAISSSASHQFAFLLRTDAMDFPIVRWETMKSIAGMNRQSVNALNYNSNAEVVAASPSPSAAMVIMTVLISLTSPPAARHISATRTKTTAPISALAFLVRFFATGKLIVLVDGTEKTASRRCPIVYLINSIANTANSAFQSVGSATRIRIAMMVKMRRTAISLPLCPPFYIRCLPQTDCVPRRTLCNGIFGCDRRSDQELCSKINEPPEVPEKEDEECSIRQFNCYMGSNECLSLSSR